MTISGIWAPNGKGMTLDLEEGIVREVREANAVPDDTYLAPGFFDLQVNGYRGYDYSGADLETQHVGAMVRLLAEAGVTRHIPTIVTNSRERILRNLGILRSALEQEPWLARAVPGVHIEGPFIASEDGPRGAHDPHYVRDATYEEYRAWQDAAGGLVRIITVAPERKGVLEFIDRVSKEGVLVGIGHTGAPPERIREAVEAGARISTHLGNGSHAVLPRLRNYLWEQLAADELWAGIIADGFHLPASVVKVFSRAKGPERLVLVSDAAVLAGSEPGIHRWGDIEVEVFADGHLGLAGTPFLAGAGHLLDRCVARFAQDAGVGIGDAVRLCTENPARFLDAADGTGTNVPPAPGDAANIVMFRYRPGDESIRVAATCAFGRTLFAAQPGA